MEKVRIAIQVFSSAGEPLAEIVSHVAAASEVEAVDFILKNIRIDMRYRFLGLHGFVYPSAENYLVLAKAENHVAR